MLSELIEKHLQTNVFGKKLILLDETDSTNLEAKRTCNKYPHGSVIIADNQTGGIGRLGRKWNSEKGKGIYMSFILKPQKPLAAAQNITLTAALSVQEALNEAVLPLTSLFSIKWPNDILSDNRKICGILAQSVSGADADNIIILGIGVNVNNNYFDSSLPNASSLKIITGSDYSREYITALIINELEKHYSIHEENGFSALKEKYKSNCASLNKYITVSALNNKTAYACDISENGELAVICGGEKILLNSGEIELSDSLNPPTAN